MYNCIYVTALFALSALTAFFVGKYAAKKWNGNKYKTVIGFSVITATVFSLLLFIYGLSVQTIKGIVFSLVLLYASYGDIKTRQADNCIHIMIAITAVIGCTVHSILRMLVPVLLMSGVFLITALLSKNFNMGGADIKLSIACALLLGYKSILGLLIALLLAVIINLIRKNREAFPLIPYLAVGFMTVYLL